MAFDPKRWGEQLRALRGTRAQPEICEASGVPQYQLSKLESGKVQEPKAADVFALSAVYGIDPAVMGAMMELYPTPEPDDNPQLVPEAKRVLGELNLMMMRITPAAQRELSGVLRGVLTAERGYLLEQTAEEEEVQSPLPDFVRKRLRGKA